MKFKHDGYHRDGSMCVYGYDDRNQKVAIFRGFPNYSRNTVVLYPLSRLVATKENMGKQEISLFILK